MTGCYDTVSQSVALVRVEDHKTSTLVVRHCIIYVCAKHRVIMSTDVVM